MGENSKLSNMLVIKNKILPIGKNYFAINLFGIIFAKGECSETILNHERIHTRQMLELIILPFYIIYVLEWIIRLFQYGNSFMAYKNISFEREAYKNQNDKRYLKKRKFFSFFKYLKYNT